MKKIVSVLILVTLFTTAVFGVDLKISQLPQLLNANNNPSNAFVIVDSVAGQTKQISLGQLDLRWQGIPTGGSADQVLAKNSSSNSDVSWKTVNKTYVGLSNVDNTSDLSKPVSTATQNALNLKANSSALAAKADKSYVDANLATKQDLLPTGTDTYVLTWDGGPTWQPASGGGGAVDSVFGRTGVVTAQTGDYTKAQVGLSNVDNTSDATKPISNDTQAALDAKQDILTGGSDGQVATWDSGNIIFTDPASGAPGVSGTLGAPISVTASGGVTFSGINPSNYKFLKSNGGSVNISASPQIAIGSVVGQEIVMYFTSDTDILTFEDGDGLDLGATFISANKRILCVFWNGTTWSEKYRR